MKSIINFLVYITLIALLSCGKDKSAPTFTKDSFPLKVGNWWEYSVKDLYSQSPDILTLTIISMKNMGDIKVFTCTIFEFGTIVDTGYFTLSDTALLYQGYKPDYSYFGNFQIKIPFKQGDKWQGTYINDSYTTGGYTTDSISLLTRKYSPVFTINRSVNQLPHYSNEQSISLTPGIGIPAQGFNITNDTIGPQSQDFILIDYHLN